jgi:hypothetical protein
MGRKYRNLSQTAVVVPPGCRLAVSIPAPPQDAPTDRGQRHQGTGYPQSSSRPASDSRALAARLWMPSDS